MPTEVEQTKASSTEPKKKFGRQMNVLKNFLTGKLSQKKSNMRFNPFSLFESKTIAIEEDPENKQQLYNIVRYKYLNPSLTSATSNNEKGEASSSSSDRNEFLLEMKERRECGTTVQDILTAKADGVDNTGNFHWPAEELLAHFLLQLHVKGGSLFPIQGKEDTSVPTILELGAGFALAGMYTASLGYHTIISDGNSGVVKTSRDNIARFGLDKCCEARTIPWQEKKSYQDLLWQQNRNENEESGEVEDQCRQRRRVRFIVGADCLFFEAFHVQLAELLVAFFAHDKEVRVVFVAPTRGKSLENFVRIFKERLAATLDDENSSKLRADQLASLRNVVSHVHDHVDEYARSVYEELHAQQVQSPELPIAEGEEAPASTPEFNPDRHYPRLVEIYCAAE